MTRGERNCNPGNVRKIDGVTWKGEQEGEDTAFECFQTPEYGIRAIAKIIGNYVAKYKLKTVRGIINRWAPPSENDTGAYVEDVAKDIGVDPDEELSFDDRTMTWLVKAIIKHENGRVIYTDSQIVAGVLMARQV